MLFTKKKQIGNSNRKGHYLRKKYKNGKRKRKKPRK